MHVHPSTGQELFFAGKIQIISRCLTLTLSLHMPPLTRHHIYIFISTHRVIKLLCSSNNSSCKCILYTPCDILLIHVGKTIINHPPVITIFIGAINHSQMDGSWHCCNHITWANYNNSQTRKKAILG